MNFIAVTSTAGRRADCNDSSHPAGGGTGGQQTILHEEQWKMPALPALLLSICVAFPLLTTAPGSFSQANSLSALRMGEYAHDSMWWRCPHAQV